MEAEYQLLSCINRLNRRTFAPFNLRNLPHAEAIREAGGDQSQGCVMEAAALLLPGGRPLDPAWNSS